MSVGAYWKTKGVGRQIHRERERQREKRQMGKIKGERGKKRADEETGRSEHVSEKWMTQQEKETEEKSPNN